MVTIPTIDPNVKHVTLGQFRRLPIEDLRAVQLRGCRCRHPRCSGERSRAVRGVHGDAAGAYRPSGDPQQGIAEWTRIRGTATLIVTGRAWMTAASTVVPVLTSTAVRAATAKTVKTGGNRQTHGASDVGHVRVGHSRAPVGAVGDGLIRRGVLAGRVAAHRRRGRCHRGSVAAAHGGTVVSTVKGWRGTALDRFMRRAQIDSESGCWVWVGARHDDGYGVFSVGHGHEYAHRWSYTHFKGPIPDGLSIDHLCGQPPCVNPDHLEAVPIRVNVLRGTKNPTALNARRTHCVNGHPFTGRNTYRNSRRPNVRAGRICLYARKKAWRQRQRCVA